jgi:hypothetical protein
MGFSLCLGDALAIVFLSTNGMVDEGIKLTLQTRLTHGKATHGCFKR